MSGLRIGLVCPYSFDRPGGVQNHVLGLAHALRGLGHRPAILAPGDLDAHHAGLPFTSAGPALPVPYNGSIARVSFGPVIAGRVRRWLRDGQFDLVHLHEPVTPSISLLALRFAAVPVVATFHTATPRSRTMQVAGDALRRLIEKIDAGIAVSEPARDVVIRHLGRDAVVIPNGFDHASFRADQQARSGPSVWRGGDRPRLTFLGRLDEPRKGLPVLLAALPAIRSAVGDIEMCLAGHGSAPGRTAGLPGVRVLGGLDERAKRALLSTTDVFVAPQIARESFGIVVLEALAAGAEVVASDLPAFADLLSRSDEAPLGHLFRRGDASRLAAQIAAVLGGGVRHQPTAGERVLRYDWSVVAPAVAEVYAAAAARPSGRLVDHQERVLRTWSALDQALIRRARRALEAADAGAGGPSRLPVHTAAAAALTAAASGVPQPHRERAESDLSRQLVASGLIGPRSGLQAEHDRAALARRLHNDAVAAAVRTRRSAEPSLRAFEMAES
ncbi:MAG TPA: glycosyltransferase family 4 protein [Microlunatus sp.]|nr:glycosyltransferase family 4 protein [Microlunatus sp.]